MDEDMRRVSIVVYTIVNMAIAIVVLAVAAPGQTEVPVSAGQRYCNEEYLYCVNFPSTGSVVPHEGDSPNHGVTIALEGQGNEAWTYAHWDSALLGSPQKVAVERLGMLIKEHPNAEITIKPVMLAELRAYRIRCNYQDIRPMVEEVVIAHRGHQKKSKDVDLIYEIGLKCPRVDYSKYSGTLEAIVSTFESIPQ